MRAIDRGLHHRLLDHYSVVAEESRHSITKVLERPELLDLLAQELPNANTRERALALIHIEALEFQFAVDILSQSKTIVFSQEQAEVFMEAHKSYFDGLDFRLPFKSLLLAFDAPILVDIGSGPDELIALLLHQDKYNQEVWERESQRAAVLHRMGYTSMKVIPPLDLDAYHNSLIAVFSDLNVRKLSWSDRSEVVFETINNPTIQKGWSDIKNLAVACIGYVNCENVYLQEEGVVKAAVNRKRAREGKKQLEPYYICKIRAAKGSDKAGHSEAGLHHGHRYDVRGHFRKLDSGRTTWVRPHQRGLEHELYIPKTYAIERGAKIIPDATQEIASG